jgi:hypothetical protein
MGDTDMSEYQYYEFLAIDRPLTVEEMSELRFCSSRARITPTSFVVDYSWGDFKGDMDAWMAIYFDAFIYLANWGTHVLKLRLPSRLLTLETAKAYCCSDSVFVCEKADKVIITFVSQDEDGEWVEGEGYLSSIVSVRAELARGDLRALYLGWLLQVQSDEFDDDDIEPPVPPGLGQLSASLESLAEFLRIDDDLLHVAAEASPPISDTSLDRDEVRVWVSKLPTREKDDLITNLIVNADHTRIAELQQRFLKAQAGNDCGVTTGRTVGQLLRASETYKLERVRIEAERYAKEKARQERAAAIAREKYLDSLAGQENTLWTEIDKLIATRQPEKYDQAVKLIIDLRDLAARSVDGDFRLRIERLRQAHARKVSFIKRLNNAKL